MLCTQAQKIPIFAIFRAAMKDISRNLLHLKNLHSGEVCQQLLIVGPGNEAKVLQLEEQIAKARVQLQAP